jgi:hypothetical protein
MINIYIHQSLWKFFEPDDRIPIFLIFGDWVQEEKEEKEVCEIGLISKMKFREGEVYDGYKKITIHLEKELKNILRAEKGIEYRLYTEAWRPSGSYRAHVLFDSSDRKGSFSDPNKNIDCYYYLEREIFAEFCFYPDSWNISNHYKWPTFFQKEVFYLLLVLKRLQIHKDLKYPIIQALSLTI